MDDQAIETQSEARGTLEKVDLRPVEKDDLPFIYSTWLKSYRSSAFAKRIKKDVYFEWHHLVIERLLARPTVKVLMACLPGHPDVIIAYLVFERGKSGSPVLHYCFVKESFRRLGIAKALLVGTGPFDRCFFSHWTYALDPIVSNHAERMIYDPYRI